MRALQIRSAKYAVQIVDDPTYTPGSADNLRAYSREYLLTDRHTLSSRHGVIAGEADGEKQAIIILAGGGGSTVHIHSALIVGDRLFIAVGNLISCLMLPSLELDWQCVVDTATCFGVYYSPENDCLISHGECEVARISMSGLVEWSASGKDIFTEGFQLFSDRIEVIDFNHEQYRVGITNGHISLVGG